MMFSWYLYSSLSDSCVTSSKNRTFPNSFVLMINDFDFFCKREDVTIHEVFVHVVVVVHVWLFTGLSFLSVSTLGSEKI